MYPRALVSSVIWIFWFLWVQFVWELELAEDGWVLISIAGSLWSCLVASDRFWIGKEDKCALSIYPSKVTFV